MSINQTIDSPTQRLQTMRILTLSQLQINSFLFKVIWIYNSTLTQSNKVYNEEFFQYNHPGSAHFTLKSITFTHIYQSTRIHFTKLWFLFVGYPSLFFPSKFCLLYAQPFQVVSFTIRPQPFHITVSKSPRLSSFPITLKWNKCFRFTPIYIIIPFICRKNKKLVPQARCSNSSRWFSSVNDGNSVSFQVEWQCHMQVC